MRSNLSKGKKSAPPTPITDTEFFDSLCLQAGLWLEGALAEAGLPEPGDDTPDAPTDRSEAAALIAAHWLAPGNLEEAWEEASDVDRTVLRAATTDARVSRGMLVRFATDRGHTPAEAETSVARLQRQALLLPLGGPASTAFKIPREIRQRLKRLLAGGQAEAPAVKPPKRSVHDHGSAFIDDFCTLLAFLRRGGYRITRSGGVHAADLRRMSERLTLPETDAGGDEPDERLFPTRVGLMMELAEGLHLIRPETDDLVVHSRHIRSWLSRTAESVHRDVVRAACRQDWRYAAEVNALATFLADTRSGEWYRLDDILDAVDGKPDFVGVRPADLLERLRCAATYLCWMGVAAVAAEELHPTLVSLTKRGVGLLEDDELDDEVESATLIVMPNFEVMMPTSADLATRWELESFADPVNRKVRGPMRTYRLERTALLNVMKNGASLRSIVDFLRRHADSLPDNVEVTLKDWSQAYGEYYFMQPTLLVCKDAAAAASARSNPKVADRVLGLLTPEILIVEAGGIDAVRSALEDAGTMPRPGVKRLPIGGPVGDADPETRKSHHRQVLQRKRASSKTRGCVLDGCSRVHTARGLCATHYQQARRGKIPFPAKS